MAEQSVVSILASTPINYATCCCALLCSALLYSILNAWYSILYAKYYTL